MNPQSQANPSAPQPAPKPASRPRSPLAAKIAGYAISAGIASGCMAPHHNIFEPRPTTTGEARPLTEDVYRAFELALRTSHHSVEISGRGGAFGSWSYRIKSRDWNVANYEFTRNTLSPDNPATMVSIGPNSQAFNISIPEPTDLVGTDVLVVADSLPATESQAGLNIATLRYQNRQGAWEIMDIEFPGRLVGSSPEFDAILSRDGCKIVIIASPERLEEGMPSAILAAVFDLNNGRVIPSDYVIVPE